MTPEKIYTIKMFGLAGLAFVGLILAVICLIIALVRGLVKKKSVRVPVVLMIAGVLLAAVGSQGFNTMYENFSTFRLTLHSGDSAYKLGEFSLTDKNGNTFDNSTLAQYRLTVINHWEPWCKPCKGELPDLEKLYEDYKDKGVNFVGIYTTEKDADQVIADNGITYANCFLDEIDDTPFGTFETGAVPVTYVVDSEGNLLNLGFSDEELQAMFDGNVTEEMKPLCSCICNTQKDYGFWAEKLDAFLK